MSVSEQADLRPARETPVLGLPIPGDAGPADYVTATGELADKIDAAVEPRVPLVTPAQLSQPPFNNPRDGQIVDLVVHGTDAVTWRLRWNANIADAYKWTFLGGLPLETYATAYASGGAANAWVGNIPPVVTIPRPGIYRLEQKIDVQSVAAPNVVYAIFFGADRASAPNDPAVWVGNTGGQATVPGNTIITAIRFGVTIPLVINEQLRTALNVSGPTNLIGSINRGMRLLPMRIS